MNCVSNMANRLNFHVLSFNFSSGRIVLAVAPTVVLSGMSTCFVNGQMGTNPSCCHSKFEVELEAAILE